MKQSYTEEKLIQLIYGECDIFERLEIEDSLLDDLCLRENYDELYKTYHKLPKVKFSPKSSTIANILHFGKGRLEAAC